MAICRTYMHTQIFSQRRLICVSVVIVIFSCAYCSLSLSLLCTGDGELDEDVISANCTFVQDPSGRLLSIFHWYERWHAILAIVDHVLALALLTASYVCVLVELRLASRRWFQLTLLKRTECSSSRMPTCIITIFVVFESPKVVMDVLCLSGLVEIDHAALYTNTTTLCMQLCTATNVIVYFIFSETIRKRLLHLFGVSESRFSRFKLFRSIRSRNSRANISAQGRNCEPVTTPCLNSNDCDNC